MEIRNQQQLPIAYVLISELVAKYHTDQEHAS